MFSIAKSHPAFLLVAIMSFALILPGAIEPASAAPCFAADADGIYDQDGLANGVITITGASSSSVAPTPTPYDCAGVDFVVQAGGQLILQGDPDTGEIAELLVGDLTIENGAAIRADGEGCSSSYDGTFGGPGNGPDDANVCVRGGRGAGGAGNDFGGSGGGGHGGRGGNGGVGAGGGPFDSATIPSLFGTSGGNTGLAATGGGSGGGVVAIAAGTVAHEGEISATGNDGGGVGGRVTGGGSGGTILISAKTFNGTSGTFVAGGGGGAGTGGGGGGGRIAILYDAGNFPFDADDFDVSGGSGGTAGENGTVYVRDRTASTVRVFHGFTFVDTDHVESAWLSDDSATNQYCDPTIGGDASPSITAADIRLGGEISCTASIDSFDFVQTGPGGSFALPDGSSVSANGALTLVAATTLEVGTGVTLANSRRTSDLVLSIPDGNDQTWNNVLIDGAAEGSIVIDATVALELANDSTVRGNPKWRNLSSLSIDSTSAIEADGHGCESQYNGTLGGAGAGPDCQNVCTTDKTGAGKAGNDFGGSGGGGHGGIGGAGGIGAGGASYDLRLDPFLFGSSAGNTGLASAGGGTGGGFIDIVVAGTLTHDGAITAHGANGGGTGGRVTGGGAGGSIKIAANEFACTNGGFIAAVGGDGAETSGGGGGGGRVSVDVEIDTCAAAPLSNLDASTATAGGLGAATGADGQAGSVSLSAASACAEPAGLTIGPESDADGIVTATDALFTLRAAVGSECCSLCVCDVNGSSDISATDALLILQFAVGQAVTLACPSC